MQPAVAPSVGIKIDGKTLSKIKKRAMTHTRRDMRERGGGVIGACGCTVAAGVAGVDHNTGCCCCGLSLTPFC